MSASSSATPVNRRRWTRSAGWPSGAWMPPSRPAARWPGRSPRPRRAGCGCCSGAPANRGRGWARPPAGSTAPR
ncbi:hypothetical protein G6F32_017431 [Rhizopus arrhizus]|nr:hypothetical protein G6F32_017431 [Rhizopus arrhizus]